MIKKTKFQPQTYVEAYANLTNQVGIWKSEKETVARYCSPSESILDVGCGTGRVGIGLCKLGYHNVCGLDVSEDMILKAKEITNLDYNIEYVCSDIVRQKCFPNNYFKLAIFSYNGLMCIKGMENRKKALNNIFDMLQPKGYLIFTVQEKNVTPENRWYTFWKEREKDFLNQGKSILDDEFGDLMVEDKGEYVFFHFTDDTEVRRMLGEQWCVIDSFWRDDRYIEDAIVLSKTNNCRFYVCQRY